MYPGSRTSIAVSRAKTCWGTPKKSRGSTTCRRWSRCGKRKIYTKPIPILIHYNELDVKPFSVAVNRWLKNFHLFKPGGSVNTKEGVDVLKTTIGIPGVVRQLMYNSAAAYPRFKVFTLFNE